MKILIKVTKDVLERTAMCGENGEYNIGKNCAIAFAVCRLLPFSTTDVHHYVSMRGEEGVVKYFINIYNNEIPTIGNFITAIPLPQEAVDFIDAFDDASPVDRVRMRPISFEVDIPSVVIDMISISEAYKVLSESKTLELVSI